MRIVVKENYRDTIIVFINTFLVSHLSEASEFPAKKITGMVSPDYLSVCFLLRVARLSVRLLALSFLLLDYTKLTDTL
jgi:hypothetical protein